MDEPLEKPVEDQDDAKILKPKQKRVLSDEARKKASENLKKGNADRIARARLENESKLAAEEDKIKIRADMKLKEIEKKKEHIKQLKESAASKVEEKPLQAVAKKKKQIVVYEESDSTDSEDSSSDEEEIIYVAKKPSKKKPTLIKEKQSKQRIQPVVEVPKTVIKFL